jgi:transcriptional regulator with XRE-family HTH domain
MEKLASSGGSSAAEEKLRQAVRELRTALGETQTQFAVRMNVSFPTLVRYELSRAPSGRALGKLFEIANGKFPEQAAVFRAAIVEEIGLSSPSVLDELANPGLIMQNPRRIYDRDHLTEGFDDHVRHINGRGDKIEAIMMHFHTSGGRTVSMAVAPPEAQSPRKKRPAITKP